MVYADNILHNIQIMSNDTNKTVVAESENIKPNQYFNYEFKEGEYLFQSIKYPWMKGKIKEKSLLQMISKL